MGMTTHEWTSSRVNGTPVPIGATDGYASYNITTAATASEYNLAINAVYRIMPASEDVYIALLSLDDGESSVSSSTGMRVKVDTVQYITTTKERHVLSIIAGGAGTCQCVRMLARDGR